MKGGGGVGLAGQTSVLHNTSLLYVIVERIFFISHEISVFSPGQVRQRVTNLVTKAYKTIKLSELCTLLGQPEEQVKEGRQWYYSSFYKILLVSEYVQPSLLLDGSLTVSRALLNQNHKKVMIFLKWFLRYWLILSMHSYGGWSVEGAQRETGTVNRYRLIPRELVQHTLALHAFVTSMCVSWQLLSSSWMYCYNYLDFLCLVLSKYMSCNSMYFSVCCVVFMLSILLLYTSSSESWWTKSWLCIIIYTMH